MDGRIVHIIYDEVIVEAREDIADDVSKIVTKKMESALGKLLLGVPFFSRATDKGNLGEIIFL